MDCKLLYKSIKIFIIVKISVFVSIYGDPREKKESWKFLLRFYGG